MHERLCQFQMRMVWSSEQLMIQGCSYSGVSVSRSDCPVAEVHALIQLPSYLVKEGGAHVVEMTKKRKEAAALLVVPHLKGRVRPWLMPLG